MKIRLIRFRDNVIEPTRAHYNDAGLDCYAQEDMVLDGITSDGGAKVNRIPLGFGLCVPDGYMAVIKPRSSMNAKGILTQIGTIDSGYRGEIAVILMNLTNHDIIINKGDRICQLVIEPVVLADLVSDLDDSRGEGGFGSSGR